MSQTDRLRVAAVQMKFARSIQGNLAAIASFLDRARRSLQRPPFLAPHWRAMVREVRRRASRATAAFDLPQPPT